MILHEQYCLQIFKKVKHQDCAKYIYTGQSCLRPNGSLPSLQDYSSTDLNFGTIQHQHQAIIPSYRFNCYGNITEWGVNVYRANNGDQHMYILDLQVWRPSPTVHTTSYYSLVGNNRFTSVLLDGGVARVTPLPQTRIQFQPGDVLGFYVESTRVNNAASRGVVLLNDRTVRGDRGFRTEEVWYANTAHYRPNYPYIVGPHGILNTFTNAAPVISVSTSKCSYNYILTKIICVHFMNLLSSISSHS